MDLNSEIKHSRTFSLAFEEHVNNHGAWQKPAISAHDNNSFIRRVLCDWLKDTLTVYSEVMEMGSLLTTSLLIKVKTHWMLTLQREIQPQPFKDYRKQSPVRVAITQIYLILFCIKFSAIYIHKRSYIIW